MKTNHQLTRPNQVITALLAILPGTTNRTTKLDLNEHMRESCTPYEALMTWKARFLSRRFKAGGITTVI